MYKIGLEYETIGIVKSIDKCEQQDSEDDFCHDECVGHVNGLCRIYGGNKPLDKLDPIGLKLHLVDKMEKKYHEQTWNLQDTFKIYLENIRKDINYEWISGYNADYIKEYRSIFGPELLLQVMAEVEYRLEQKICPICKDELEVPNNPKDYHPNHICECGRLKKKSKDEDATPPEGFKFMYNAREWAICKGDYYITSEAYSKFGKPLLDYHAIFARK